MITMHNPPTPPSGTTVFLLWWSRSSDWDGRLRSRSFPAESPAWKVAFRYLARSPAHEVRLFYVTPRRPCEPAEVRNAVATGLYPMFTEQLDRLAAAGVINTQGEATERIALAAAEASASARLRLMETICAAGGGLEAMRLRDMREGWRQSRHPDPILQAAQGEALLREETTTTTR